ncbi:glycerate kinase type-2 family protein [Natronomonas sp. EA1]|uniref:glycerate kinase type-2 family protein n=1 Tax=Natronomonas sp. EA1 TaxID=3421655 RepID=UPI003EB965E9
MIRNRDALERSRAHVTALECLEAALAAADPELAVEDAVWYDGAELRVDGTGYALPERVLVVGAGKGVVKLVRGLQPVLAAAPVELDGVVVADEPAELDGVEVVVGGHPVPNEGSVAGGEAILEALASADSETLVLACFTGGASALCEVPGGDLTIDDVREATQGLLDAGAPIEATNAVRRHCSRVKGGRLAATAGEARVVGLLISDVAGDDPAVIASGPVAGDPTTYRDALDALDKYGVEAPAVRAHLEAGVRGDHGETPDAIAVPTHVLASARTTTDAAHRRASERGYATCVLTTRLRGEARGVAPVFAAIAEELDANDDPVETPAVVLAAGETTVRVTGDGVGGPNGELASAVAPHLPPRAAFAAIDTDGKDGSAEHAGAIVGPGEVTVGEAEAALRENDSHTLLADCLVDTGGATGTNVNDLVVLVVEQ